MRFAFLLLAAAAAYAPMAQAGFLLTSNASRHEVDLFDLVNIKQDCAALKASPKVHITRLKSVDLSADHGVLTLHGEDGSVVQRLRDASYPDVMEGVRSWDASVIARNDVMLTCWDADATTPVTLSFPFPSLGEAQCYYFSVPACLGS